MPGYKGHLLGGLITYLLIMLVFVSVKPSFITACEWLFFTLAGSLFPDIDVKSKGQKYFYYVVLVCFIWLMYLGSYHMVSCLSCIAITPMLVRHRGIFHKSWFLVFIVIGTWIFMSTLFPTVSRPLLINLLLFLAGALSHLFFDHRMHK
jgi:hypothetical protein